MVIGAGGLGSPTLMYLTGAGIGTIGIVENDTVALSNIHRQILYSETDLDNHKAECVKQQLESRNSTVCIKLYKEWWNDSNADDIAGV